MASAKKYFQDHVILLLLSTNVFLTAVTVFNVLYQLSQDKGSSYITQYRRPLFNPYQTGSVVELFSFILFALLVVVLHTVLSMRMYQANRHVSLVILLLGTLLLVLAGITSNALLALR